MQMPFRAFSLVEAEHAGLTRARLRAGAWRRIGPYLYERAAAPARPIDIIRAYQRRLPEDAAFSGNTAAWIHGADAAPCAPVDVTLSPGSAVAARAGARLHRANLDGDVQIRRGLRVTTPVRTVADVALRAPLTDGVIVADQLLRLNLTTRDDLLERSAAVAGRPGASRLRHVIRLANPRAESPMETHVRVLLALGGLPEPRVQAELFDADGILLGRTDLYYPARRLAIEYDGAVHRGRLADDARRQNRIVAAGYVVLRFTADDVLRRPAAVVQQVREVLAA